MKSTPTLLAFIGLAVGDVAAQITAAPVCPGGPCSSAVAAVPACASSCISSAAATAAKCVDGDFQCQCVSSAVIQDAAVGCVLGGCTDPIAVINAVSTVCNCVSQNPSTYCGSPSTSTSSTSPTSETKPPTTSQPTTVPTSTSKPPSSSPTSEPPSSSPTSTGGNTDTSKPGSSPPPTSTGSCVPTKSDCAPVAKSAVPECAQACFTSYAPSVGCGVTDFACQCQPTAQASLSKLLVPCVATACPAAQLPSVIAGASSVCACATAAPGAGNCSGGGGGGSTSQPPPTSSPSSKPGDNKPSSTCKAATKADCGPVASSAVPSCAQACFSQYAPSVGCAVTDYGCQCQPTAQASLSKLLVPCVATACEAAQLPSVIAGASSVCACASAPPSGGDCGGATNPPPATTPCPTNPPNNGGGNGGGNGGSNGGGNGGGNGGNGGQATTCVEVTIAAPGGGSSGGGNAACAPLASKIESCAQPCFSSAIPKVGCAIDDYSCQCEAGHQASLSQILVPCVATACQAAVLPSIIAEASAVCACAATAGSGGSGNAGAKPITTTTCYPIGGGGSTSKPTGGSGGNGGGSGGNGGGNGGGSGGGATKSGPVTVPTAGANAKFEIGVVGTIFGAAWLAAIAL